MTSQRVCVEGALFGVVAVAGATVPLLSRTLGVRTVILFALAVVLTGIVIAAPGISIPVAVSTVMFFALVRRVFPSPTPANDIAAIFPFLVAAPLAWGGLRHWAPLSVVCFLGWSAATMVLSLGTPLVGLAGLANLAVPMTIGLAAARLPNGTSVLRRSFVVTGAIAATYGLIQYSWAFAWDARWLRDTGFTSSGQIGSAQFRPFATLPAPGTMAVVAAVVVLLVVLPHSPVHGLVRVWAGSTCALILVLSQVRSVWIATAAALIVAAVGDARRARRTLAAVAFLGFVVVLLSPEKTTLLDRVKTLSNPGADRSYAARTNLLHSGPALASPLGRGIGHYSAGSRTAGGSALDNGYLVVLAETGLVGAALLIWVFASVLQKATIDDYPFLGLLLVVNAAGFAMGGIGALPLWATCGLQRAGKDRRTPHSADEVIGTENMALALPPRWNGGNSLSPRYSGPA